MLHAPRDMCVHMLHKTQGYVAAVLSPGPVRNIPISTAKLMAPDSDTSQSHSAQSSRVSSHRAGPKGSLRDGSCPSTGPPPVSGATRKLRSGLSGSQRATCPGSVVWTSLPLPAGTIVPVCPVASMVTQEQRLTVRCETGGRVRFGLVERCQMSRGRGRMRAVGLGVGWGGGQRSHDSPGGR